MAMGSEKNFRPAAVAEVSAGFFGDPKIIGIYAKAGERGVTAFLRLLLWAAKWRSDGSMRDIDDDLIERIAEFTVDFGGKPVVENTPGALVGAMRKYGLLTGEGDESRLSGLEGLVSFHPVPRRVRGRK